MQIRKADIHDAAAIVKTIVPIIREGTTYTLDRELSEAEALSYWLGPDKTTFVAEESGAVLGTYSIRPNQAGGGGHVCNCGYMTHPGATGRGIARSMCEHSGAFNHPVSGYVDAPVMYRSHVAQQESK